MNIDINQAPPTLADIEKRRIRLHVICYTVWALVIGLFGYKTYLVSMDGAVISTIIMSYAICGVFVFAAFSTRMIAVPYAYIDNSECAKVLKWEKKSAGIRHYVELVKAQNREIIGAEYSAFESHLALEESTKHKRELYRARF